MKLKGGRFHGQPAVKLKPESHFTVPFVKFRLLALLATINVAATRNSITSSAHLEAIVSRLM